MLLDANRQTGFGLLELLLVLVIAALLVIMGLRMYDKQKMLTQIDQSKQTAQLLLHAADNYYYAYCAQDINGQSQAAQNRMPGYYDQYQRATIMLTDPTILTVDPDVASSGKISNLQALDKYNNQFLESGLPTFFPFGSFANGEMYQIQLTYQSQPYQSNNCVSASSDQTGTPQNCFAQTALWQAQVSACVTAFTTEEEDKKTKKKHYVLPDPAMIQGMFAPNDITPSSSNQCAGKPGYVITWENIPSIRQRNFSDQGDSILSADQKEFNQMYRYGPWMQQGNLATTLKQRLEYLCQ